MPTILSARESQVLLTGPAGGAGAPIEGLQAITFRVNRSRSDIAGVGTDERIGVDFGLKLVTGALTVKSTNETLDGILTNNQTFQLTANLKRGDLLKTVAFDECFLDDKQVSLDANGVVVTIYSFTATRVREA
ncbi:MAG TPA: hypothetical protein VGJ60_15690 [Chloroflexota bacterium]|jgi:hypothetical protein